MTETPAGPATMSDVARLAGVSVMTVSNVVNGRAGRVSDDTRARVLAAIESLAYRVNVPARQLRQGRSGTIALAVPDFTSPYYGELAARLADRLAGHGLRLVVERTLGAVTEELAVLERSRLDAYDGLLLALAGGSARDLEALDPARPMVLLGERASSPRLDHVAMDNVGGARLATGLLLDRGATRVAVIGGSLADEPSMSSLRTRGWLEAHRERGLEPDPALVVGGGVGLEAGHDAVARLSAAGVAFDAVLGLTDSAAIGALAALAEGGRRVPADVQVVGWDATEAARFAVPALTTVDPRNDAMADEAVRLLLRRLSGETGPAEHVAPPAVLLERATTR
ncbi:LacI family DNA-binding transcriptional regulator [Demequina soli]|uniref:LacI family DNA-binding transcriptional regulator n=1 Tax=Demequina soli TaxID=1638987 RepID=UPI000783EF5D|nr:LacI family DNA-binding transcriptional regulator [Demequina soli]